MEPKPASGSPRLGFNARLTESVPRLGFNARLAHPGPCPEPEIHPAQVLLAIGVIAKPSLTFRRSWLRSAAQRFAEPLVSQRFVLGCPFDGTLLSEAKQHADLVATSVRDSTSLACIEKSFSWWRVSLTIFPAATYIAKSDDDSMNHLSNWMALLAPTASVLPIGQRRLVYGGWVQFSSYLPAMNQPCGWAAGPSGALAARHTNATRAGSLMTNCKFCVNHPFCYDRRGQSSGEPLNASILGPYLFASGPLELMSAPLVKLVFESNATRELMERASRPSAPGGAAAPRTKYNPRGRMWAPWSCAAEDSFVGLAVYVATVAERASGVELWSLAPLVMDAHGGVLAAKLEELLTVHKLELDYAQLREDAAREERDNARIWANKVRRNESLWRHRNETYRHMRERIMSRLRPRLEVLNHSLRAPTRHVRCHSRADVRVARAWDLLHPCASTKKASWCQRRTALCNTSAEQRAACPRECGLCTPRSPHPAIVKVLEAFEGYELWRFCTVEQEHSTP